MAQARALLRRRRVLADGRDPRRRRVHRRGVCRSRVDEGATTINIPDTVGYTTPDEYARLSGARCYELVPGPGRRRPSSVHCHDDLGLAVANSFAGVLAGARQVECAINGIGERAGNASLEEIVMLLHAREAAHGLWTRRRHARARPHEPHGLAPHRLPGAAEQGDRRPQRVRARVRHPPGRRAEGAHHLRDHGRRPTSASSRTRSCSASTPGRHALRDALEELGFKVEGDALNTGVQALQGARGQEEAGHRARPRGDRLRRDEARRRPPSSWCRSTSRPSSRALAARARAACACPAARSSPGSFTGDGPVDAIFSAINAATGREATLARVPRVSGHRRARTRSAR